MSWGTDFTADLFLSHIIVKTVEEANDKIEELLEENNEIETSLKMMVIAHPRDLVPDKEEDLVLTLSFQVDGWLEDYRENVRNMFMLNLFKESLSGQ